MLLLTVGTAMLYKNIFLVTHACYFNITIIQTLSYTTYVPDDMGSSAAVADVGCYRDRK